MKQKRDDNPQLRIREKIADIEQLAIKIHDLQVMIENHMATTPAPPIFFTKDMQFSRVSEDTQLTAYINNLKQKHKEMRFAVYEFFNMVGMTPDAGMIAHLIKTMPEDDPLSDIIA